MSSAVKSVTRHIKVKAQRTFAEGLLAFTPEKEVAQMADKRDVASFITGIYHHFEHFDGDMVTVFPVGDDRTGVIVHTLDKPFVVDTVGEEMHARGYEILHTFHPVFAVQRDDEDNLTKFTVKTPTSAGTAECFLYMEVDAFPDENRIVELHRRLSQLITQVGAVTEDFAAMRGKLKQALTCLPDTRGEEQHFLRWLNDGHFIFLGYRHYVVSHERGKTCVATTKGSGYGILRDDRVSSTYHKTCLTDVPPNLRYYFEDEQNTITVTKTLDKSPLHRRAYMDYVGVKETDANGRLIGEHRFIGLFTSKAYALSPLETPLVRRKIDQVMKTAGLPEDSHNLKALLSTLQTYPRDELFHSDVDDLSRIATGIVKLKERQDVRAFIRHARHERLVTLMVFIPRDRMNSGLRRKIVAFVQQAYQAEDMEFITTLGESRLARLYMRIRTALPETPDIADDAVESRIVDITRLWDDKLLVALRERYGSAEGRVLYQRYQGSYPVGYKEHNSAADAVADIEVFETGAKFDVLMTAGSDKARLKIFHKGSRIALSALMPTFQRMGLYVTDEHPAKIVPEGAGDAIWVHDFSLALTSEQAITPEMITVLTTALKKSWRGLLETDTLDRLILAAGLPLKKVVLIRALAAYVKQTGMSFSKEYLHAVILRHPGIISKLCDLFDMRFNPAHKKRNPQKIITEIDHALTAVPLLDEDKILRQIKAIILATVRTNAYQTTDITAPLAFKIDSSQVPHLPKPRPLYEIFVYHSTVEGIHLRGGKVARGGLRWSDRVEDYRTEVLGLVKAQMTKNTVIVPLGSKGGFIVKGKSDLSAFEQARASYRIFITSLLSVTDNLAAGKVTPPYHVVRYDDDDPYLVVAADKGTATFSDTANEIALHADFWPKRGFWLGDAFASGGSNGYDHKKMGITARGAWECVKHHFRTLGIDTQKQPFSVAAIGDMAGDVFGNGMLLSKHIQLVAAFNHKHIFIDPTPDIPAAYAERQRLFKAVQGWDSYDQALLSSGGAIFSRADKSLTLSPEIQELLGIQATKITPNELIKAILRMEVDLLWNGGIGTYVKASDESDADVGDRANDPLRIDATELNARVVGEGGNLGLTQRGRIEFALAGGLIHTDAVDNSAGVNSSDYEVNIKILLNILVESGDLTDKQRNKLLRSMTAEVAALSLRANYEQSATLMLAARISESMLGPYTELMQVLEKKGLLDRAVEFLPDDETLEAREKAGLGLTAPELAVLMAYAKMDLYNTLLDSKLPGEEVMTARYLPRYFPVKLVTNYPDTLPQHPLRREIVATVLTNTFINRMGLTFLSRMAHEVGAETCTVVRAYVVASELLGVDAYYRRIESMDGRVPAAVQNKLRAAVKKLLESTTSWFLRREKQGLLDVESLLARYHKPFAAVRDHLSDSLTDVMRQEMDVTQQHWQEQGLKKADAAFFAQLPLLNCSAAVASLSLPAGKTVKKILALYMAVGDVLRFNDIGDLIRAVPLENNWQRMAMVTQAQQIYRLQSDVTAWVSRSRKAPEAAIEDWVVKTYGDIDGYHDMVDVLLARSDVTQTMIQVAVNRAVQLFEQAAC